MPPLFSCKATKQSMRTGLEEEAVRLPQPFRFEFLQESPILLYNIIRMFLRVPAIN